MELYHQGGMDAVLSDTKQKVELLKSVGINAGLFPVADLARDQSAFIYDRTIGQDAQTTASYVQQVVEELKKSKFGSTLKHFRDMVIMETVILRLSKITVLWMN